MFGRPRCREWTPLATQQLRLRSLLQIVGYNIRPPEGCRSQCSFYLTLHHTTMCAPFYTSERISSPHPKWKEIDSEVTQRMSSNNVVIRIWCHVIDKTDDDPPQDTIIQTWGVYFSGLRYIGANLALNFTSDCFKCNTLVFQMLGGYFCSYKSLKLDIIPPENEIEHGSLSSDSSGRTNFSKTIEAKFIQHQRAKESRSISPNKFSRKPDKEYSKSNSPVERNFNNYSELKTSTSLNISRERGDVGIESKKIEPIFIYEHSPDSMDITVGDNCENLSKNSSREKLSNSKIDLSETAENYDLRNENEAPKFRYLALNFLKSEIRHSYNAKKLQQLHILQYEIKKKQGAVAEIKEKIYKRSALSNDWSLTDDFDDKLRIRSSQRNLFSLEEEKVEKAQSVSEIKNGRIKEDRPITSNGPRLTLKLNDLLSFKTKPSPFQRAEALRLTKQIEILRFKRLILADERDRKLASLRKLKEDRAKLLEENQDLGLELLENYHTLSRRSEILRETRQSCGALRELAARSHAALQNQRCQLLNQLHQIFYIEQKDETTWSICGVELPICGDAVGRAASPLRDAVASGLAAQATCLAACLADQPLRYKITLLGSASKILDVTPDLPDPNIPLFARGGDVALFRYAMFLLNKCIAQLLWARGLPVSDMRPTLANLKRLLTTRSCSSDTSKLFGTYHRQSDTQCPRAQSLRSLVASERGKYNRQFNRFKDSVDGQSPETAMNLRRHRHSRSVGSYQDDQELPTLDQSTTSIMGSEPNIYNTKLPQENIDTPISMKTHNSDSEISRLSGQIGENRVVFTLGEDSPSTSTESQKLVRISTNNDDEITCFGCLDDNVKRICTEITDFCTKDIHEGYDIARHIESTEHIDIVKHMERKASEIEDADICKNCKSNKDGVCDLACAKTVQDVIVIPSAEAILDTGQEIAEDRRKDTSTDILQENVISFDGKGLAGMRLDEKELQITIEEEDSRQNIEEPRREDNEIEHRAQSVKDKSEHNRLKEIV